MGGASPIAGNSNNLARIFRKAGFTLHLLPPHRAGSLLSNRNMYTQKLQRAALTPPFLEMGGEGRIMTET